MTLDPRVMGFYRIVFGTLLCLDLLRHWKEARFLYSVAGAFPNDKHLFRPSSGNLFSVFHAFSTVNEVHVLFALGLLCHFLFLIGYRTRLFAILGFIFVTSMDSRIPLVENGGYVVVNLQCLYAMFLPLGRRFSVDAWLASWRARKETTLADLADRSDSVHESQPTQSLVGLTALINLSFVYLFNVINKSGAVWRHGDTVHYVLHINRMVTGVAVFFRDHMPEWSFKIADFTTLSCEATVFVCIVSWRARKVTRLVAMGLMFGLHTTFGIMMRLGPFSWFLIGWSTMLLLPIHVAAIQRIYEKRSAPIELGLRATSAFALALGRVVKRLDGYGRVAFVAAEGDALVSARRSGEAEWVTEPRAALALVTQALPLGRALYFLPRILGGSSVFATLVRHASTVERFFGLDLAEREPDASSPLRLRVRRWLVYPREALIAYLALCATLQVYMENKAFPKTLPPEVKPGVTLDPQEQKGLALLHQVLGSRVITLKPDPPWEFLQTTINYPRTFQGWGMFAPNPIQEDGVLAVDAYTIDGRRIDPLTGQAPDLDLTDSKGEGLSQLRQDYGNRIRLDRNQYYREGLKEYLLKWQLETGNPNDELVAFDVYWVRDRCPKPGSDKPYDGDAVPILTYRKPGYRAPGAFPQIPYSPRVRSAEKWDTPKTIGGRVVERPRQ